MYINYSLIMFTFWKPSAPIWYGNNYKHMKPQSALHNYNLVKLGKRKNKSTIQFFKVESPLHNLFWQIPPYWNQEGGHQFRGRTPM